MVNSHRASKNDAEKAIVNKVIKLYAQTVIIIFDDPRIHLKPRGAVGRSKLPHLFNINHEEAIKTPLSCKISSKTEDPSVLHKMCSSECKHLTKLVR